VRRGRVELSLESVVVIGVVPHDRAVHAARAEHVLLLSNHVTRVLNIARRLVDVKRIVPVLFLGPQLSASVTAHYSCWPETALIYEPPTPSSSAPYPNAAFIDCSSVLHFAAQALSQPPS